MPDAIEKVGLGMDLLGGGDTLAQLKAIRAEMEAIVRLGGGGPTSGKSAYGPSREDVARTEQFIRTREQQEIASIRRVELARARANAPISGSEIETGLRNRQRAQKLKSDIQALNEKEQQDFLKYQSDRRARVAALKAEYAKSGINPDLDIQRRSFKQYRNDPARDTQTNEYRKTLSEELQARKAVLAERRAVLEQEKALRARLQAERQQIANENASKFDDFRIQSVNRANAARLARAGFNQSGVIGSRPDAEFESIRQSQIRARRLREEVANAIPNTRAGTTGLGADPEFEELKRQAQERRRSASRKASASKASALGLDPDEEAEFRAFLASGNTDLNKFTSSKQAAKNEQARRDNLVAKARQRKADNAYVKQQLGDEGGGPGGGSGGGGGFGGAVSRLTRNFIIYEALSLVTRDLKEYISVSLEAAKATSEQANALTFATEAAKGNLDANRDLATQLQSTGLNRAEASGVVAAATRATYRRPDLTAAFTREAVDIAALRGGGLKETPRIIEDLIGGRDRAYREYLNITPQDIYKQAAKKKLESQAGQGFVGIGNKDYDTETQKIAKYVTALTEEEKEQLRLNYVLSQSYRFQGDAIERAGTLAGKMDLVSAAFFNASANVGAFITDIKPVKDILDQIAGATPDSVFTPAVLRQGGPQNTITDANIIKYGSDVTSSSRADALSAISKVSSLVANNITLVNTFKNINDAIVQRITTGAGTLDDSATSVYAKNVAENQARAKQVKQRNVLRQEGKLGYRALDSTGPIGEYFSREQLYAQGLTEGDIVKHYVEDIRPVLEDGAKALDEYRKTRAQLVTDIAKNAQGFFGEQRNNTALNALDAARDYSIISGFIPTGYAEDARKREDDRKAKQEKQKAKDYQESANALAKLRDAEYGSFKLIGDIGTSLTGPDNQFTKILADQITSAERMRQQWGFLGDAAVKYFDTLEQKALARQLNAAEFGAYTTASNITGRAAKEAADRGNTTTLSRRDQEYLDIQSAILDRAKQIPEIWKQAADVLRVHLRPDEIFGAQLNLITQAFGVNGPVRRNALGQDITRRDGQRYNAFGQSLGGVFDIAPRKNVFGQSLEDPSTAGIFSRVGAGQPAEVQRVLRKSFADSVVEAFKNFSPAQIRASGYQDFYLGALRQQGQSLGDNIQQARAKAEFSAKEDFRLKQQLEADAQFRAKQIASGRDAADVGRESDKLLLARTDNIPIKDLTYDQFTARQEAQRREAERATQDQEEAKKATQKALEYQRDMQRDIQTLREAIVGGKISALIQVQNDTQARVDKENLDLATGDYSALDQRNVKASAYTPSTERYKRAGGKYGLSNR